MVAFVFKILVGLFFVLVLPKLLVKKKSSPWKKFIDIACWIVGVLIIVQAVIKFVEILIL